MILLKYFLVYILLFIGIILIPQEGIHATYFDANLLYFSDNFKSESTTTISRTQYDVSIGFDIKKNRLMFAVAYGSTQFSDKNNTSNTTFSCTDMGLKLIYYWAKDLSWSSALTYNFSSIAKYNDGTNEVDLRGTSIKADLGYNFWWKDYSSIGLKLYYYAPSFKESVAAETTITKVTYTRTTIYPGISIIFQF